MKQVRPLSSRALFIIVAVTTVILIVGSALLQRVVFKAEESSASLYFSPSLNLAAPTSVARLTLQADLSAPSYITGAQLSLNIKGSGASFTGATAEPGWQVVRQNLTSGTLELLILPSVNSGPSVLVSSQIKLAEILLSTNAEGSSTISIDPARTTLGARSAEAPNIAVNILSSVQDATLTLNAGTLPTVKSASPPEQPATATGIQRVRSAHVLASPGAAVVFVALERAGKIQVRFGQSEQLESLVEQAAEAKNVAIRLSGLEAGKRYYYRLVVDMSDTTSQTITAVKSFQTPLASEADVANRVELDTFPSTISGPFIAYAVALDENEQALSNPPAFSVTSGNATVGPVSTFNGLHQVTVTPTIQERQAIEINVSSNAATDTKTVLFDPNHSDDSSAIEPGLPLIAQNQKTTLLLAGLLAALWVIGYLFVKLARNR